MYLVSFDHNSYPYVIQISSANNVIQNMYYLYISASTKNVFLDIHTKFWSHYSL